MLPCISACDPVFQIAWCEPATNEQRVTLFQIAWCEPVTNEQRVTLFQIAWCEPCLLYTSPSPRD